MSTINNFSTTAPAGTTASATAATSSTTTTGAASAVGTNANAAPVDAMDSVAGTATAPPSAVKPISIDFNPGEGINQRTFISTAQLTVGGSTFGAKKESGAYERGEIEIKNLVATDKGCLITIHIKKQKKNDDVVLRLQAQLQDSKHPAKVITLARLGEKFGNPPVSTVKTSDFDEILTFEIDYDKMNEGFAQQNGRIQLKAGAPLAVFGRFGGFHQSGGFHRMGTFYIPQRNVNPLPQLTIGSDTNLRGTSKPMDMEVAYPKSLSDKFKTALKAGGKAMSRVEAEAKIDVPLDKIFSVYNHIEELTTNDRMRERILGKEWEIIPIDRYYQRDEDGLVLKDANGLPQTDPMVDTYTDDKARSMAKAESVFRLREKEGDRSNYVNVKPGSGLADADFPWVRHRIERSLEVTPEAAKDFTRMRNFLNSSQPLNPLHDIFEVAPGVSLSELSTPSMKIVDRRYKFMLKHLIKGDDGKMKPDGIEVELSLDDCYGVPMEGGKLMKDADGNFKSVHIGQLEAEVAHVNLVSKNQLSNKGADAEIKMVRNKHDQIAFIKALGNDAEFVGPPPMHTLSDLPGFFDKDSTYKTYKKMLPGLMHFLFDGEEILPAKQKYHELAKVSGIIESTDAEKAAYTAEIAARAAIDKETAPDFNKYLGTL